MLCRVFRLQQSHLVIILVIICLASWYVCLRLYLIVTYCMDVFEWQWTVLMRMQLQFMLNMIVVIVFKVCDLLRGVLVMSWNIWATWIQCCCCRLHSLLNLLENDILCTCTKYEHYWNFGNNTSLTFNFHTYYCILQNVIFSTISLISTF